MKFYNKNCCLKFYRLTKDLEDTNSDLMKYLYYAVKESGSCPTPNTTRKHFPKSIDTLKEAGALAEHAGALYFGAYSFMLENKKKFGLD